MLCPKVLMHCLVELYLEHASWFMEEDEYEEFERAVRQKFDPFKEDPDSCPAKDGNILP